MKVPGWHSSDRLRDCSCLVCALSELTPFHSDVENEGFFIFCSLLVPKQCQWKSCDVEPSIPSVPLGQPLDFGLQGAQGAAVSGLSVAPRPCAGIPSSQTFEGRFCGWPDKDDSWAFTQILPVLGEEADETLWRTLLEEPFTEGSYSHQQLNCRSFSKAAMHRRAEESSKREITP